MFDYKIYTLRSDTKSYISSMTHTTQKTLLISANGALIFHSVALKWNLLALKR